MIITSTDKTIDNDYLDNSQCRAIVHVRRIFGPTEAGSIDLPIENLDTIKDFIFQVRKTTTGEAVFTTLARIEGNVISFGNVTANTEANLLIIGQ